jgi:hypothetical protein
MLAGDIAHGTDKGVVRIVRDMIIREAYNSRGDIAHGTDKGVVRIVRDMIIREA